MDDSSYNPVEERISGKIGFWIIRIILIFGIIFQLLLLLFISTNSEVDKNSKAILFMGFFALWIFWIGIFGTLMHIFRDKIKNFIEKFNNYWKITFILFCTSLALIEEIITVTTTNLYWLFGGEYGKAYITASNNYFEVIFLHSVIVFWPSYLFWSWWLSKYDFHYNWVFLLYGISGVFSEMTLVGFQAIIASGMWIHVYGLFIYLPAYCIPKNREVIKPSWYHYLLTQILPIFFQLPIILLVSYIRKITNHQFPFIKN